MYSASPSPGALSDGSWIGQLFLFPKSAGSSGVPRCYDFLRGMARVRHGRTVENGHTRENGH